MLGIEVVDGPGPGLRAISFDTDDSRIRLAVSEMFI